MELENKLYKQMENKVRNTVSDLIDESIKEQVEQFERILFYQKDKYISEIMKNIVVSMDKTPLGLNFTIKVCDSNEK